MSVRNVLILCTGNSARSILGEALIDLRGGGRFRGHSAGSHPRGQVNPFALELLRAKNLPTGHLRSKPWDAFATADAPRMDFIFTVCDEAAGEPCPIWPGHPATAHWGLPDPAGVGSDDAARRRAFADAWTILDHRVKLFLALPFDTLDATALKARLADIGRAQPETMR